MSEAFFKVGEICEGKDFIFYAEYNGVECEILQPHDSYAVTDMISMKNSRMVGYMVRWADGSEFCVMHKHLKKRKPPAPYKEFSTTVSWDACAWKPRELETLQ